MGKETKDVVTSKFLIPISELEGETIIQFNDLRPAELNLDSKKVKSFRRIDAVVKLNTIPTGIAADFEVNFVVELTCIRCLEAFTKTGGVNINLEYIEGKDPFAKIDGVELKAADMNMVYYRGAQIDLGIGIREAIILSLPIAPLCKDGCQGLCPVCGKNMNKITCRCKVEKVELFIPKSMNVKEMDFNKSRGKKKSRKKT